MEAISNPAPYSIHDTCEHLHYLAALCVHACILSQLFSSNTWHLAKPTVRLHVQTVVHMTKMFLTTDPDGMGRLGPGLLPWGAWWV